MLLGKVLVTAAMKEGKFVTWLPAYGAEVRGGAAHCMVVISDETVGSPYVDKADTLIVMNLPSLDKFKARLKSKGLLILNSSLAEMPEKKNLQIMRVPFTQLAEELGNSKVANMAALGCFLKKKKVAAIETALKVLEEIAPADKKDLVGINKEALRKGAELTNV